MNSKALADVRNIAERALEKLVGQTGFKGEWRTNTGKGDFDGDLVLTLPMEKIRFRAEVKKTLRQQQLPDIFARAEHNAPFILIAEELFPKLKEQLRARQIAYLDGSGNFFLSLNGHYVWVDGNKSSKTERPAKNRVFTKAGLKTVFHLLTQGSILKTNHREIAARSGVALGNIGLIISGLKENGFLVGLNRSEAILKNKRLLLDRWIDGYQHLLKPSLYVGTFDFGEKAVRENWKNLPLLSGDNWGSEAAAELSTNYLNAEDLTLYTTYSRAEIMKHWKLLPAKNGSLHVYRKFWDDGGSNADITPHLLTFADLVTMHDPRCSEAAETIFNTHLKTLFDEHPSAQNPFRYT
jgi:hypothetical protein